MPRWRGRVLSVDAAARRAATGAGDMVWIYLMIGSLAATDEYFEMRANGDKANEAFVMALLIAMVWPVLTAWRYGESLRRRFGL